MCKDLQTRCPWFAGSDSGDVCERVESLSSLSSVCSNPRHGCSSSSSPCSTSNPFALLETATTSRTLRSQPYDTRMMPATSGPDLPCGAQQTAANTPQLRGNCEASNSAKQPGNNSTHGLHSHSIEPVQMLGSRRWLHRSWLHRSMEDLDALTSQLHALSPSRRSPARRLASKHCAPVAALSEHASTVGTAKTDSGAAPLASQSEGNSGVQTKNSPWAQSCQGTYLETACGEPELIEHPQGSTSHLKVLAQGKSAPKLSFQVRCSDPPTSFTTDHRR